MKLFITLGKKPHGRPPVVDLTDEQLRTIRSYYLPTNRNKRKGSIRLAWVRFCEETPGFGHLVQNHLPVTTIPAAVMEACRAAAPLVGANRGGERRVRHESAYVPGTMRRHWAMNRRLWAGEQASIDDATRNVACWIPWPWGGCPCSDKFGVRLGRWQTLVVHDDATSFIPFVASVFRWHQSYRATDAAAAIYQTERKVVQFDRWAIEGGVWQAKRTLDILGGRFISAKGRPNQKLVENFFDRLWTVMAGQPGDVGRHQAEIKRNSELYVAARAGRVDPRQHFMSLSQGQEQLYQSIQYLNERPIISKEYGKWIPQERWEMDLAEAPRQARSAENDFLILPVKETRVVVQDSVSIREDGPLGMPMNWRFTADWLSAYRGRRLDVYFDPSQEWPVSATVCLEGQRKPLGTVECLNPIGESKDRAAELCKAVRQTVLTETRVLSKLHQKRTERLLRHPSGVASTISPIVSTADTPISRENEQIITSRPFRDSPAAAPRVSREDLVSSRSRKLAALRGEEA